MMWERECAKQSTIAGTKTHSTSAFEDCHQFLFLDKEGEEEENTDGETVDFWFEIKGSVYNVKIDSTDLSIIVNG